MNRNMNRLKKMIGKINKIDNLSIKKVGKAQLTQGRCKQQKYTLTMNYYADSDELGISYEDTL